LRVTIEKDTSPAAYATPAAPSAPISPNTSHGARKAFEDLFKK